MALVVYGLVPDYATLDRIVSGLEHRGFGPDAISVVMPEDAKHTLTHERHSKAPEGAVAGGTIGGVAGGITGLLAGIGVLAIPGLGPLIAAGPLLAALSGLAVGGVAGSFAGSLVGLGIPELEAKQYAERLARDDILVATHVEDPGAAAQAEQAMRDLGATNIASTRDDTDAA